MGPGIGATLTKMPNKKKITAIDIDMQIAKSEGVAYVRITKELKDFLELCNKKHGIIGFEYEQGSFNFGVILKPKNAK